MAEAFTVTVRFGNDLANSKRRLGTAEIRLWAQVDIGQLAGRDLVDQTIAVLTHYLQGNWITVHVYQVDVRVQVTDHQVRPLTAVVITGAQHKAQ